MRLGALAFLVGVLALHALPELPSRAWAWALPGVLLTLWRMRRLRLLAWGLAGFLWALWLIPSPQVLPTDLARTDLAVEGWIVGLPDREWRNTRFDLIVARAEHAGQPVTPLTGQRLRLNWWRNSPDSAAETIGTMPELRVGDRWRFTLRLQAPRGLRNPGGFDYERFLYAKNIAATGTVRSDPPPQWQASAERQPLDRYRQRIAAAFNRQLPDDPFTGVLIALAVGEENGVSAAQWTLFNRLGVGHLLSVSGSHIGLVAGLGFALVWGLWSRTPRLTQRWPASRAAAVAALACALVYTLLSGWDVPAQRALLMATVALSAVWLQRAAAPSRGLALALLAVLIWEPAAPLRVGFWLSFGAVAALLYALSGQRERESSRLGKIIRAQWGVTVALLPPTLIFFQQIPLLSPLANLIAIPWIGCTVLPLSLLVALLEPVGGPAQAAPLHLAALTMEGLWRVLLWLDQWPGIALAWPAPPLWTLGLALPGAALLLAPRGLPGRWLGLPLCLPLFWPPLTAPQPGGFWFTLLDTGQGLAAVVRTRQHVLAYDAGPRLGATLDAGQAVLTPFLRQQGLRQIDLLLISHDDRQHTGGVRSLREQWPVIQLLTADPVQTPLLGATTCRAGQNWNWDGVQFQMLHPPPTGFRSDNASCVLKVTSPAGRVLLPGDIERPAETALVKRYGAELAAEILVAPHHGHRNLSTDEFLQAVQPRYVLFATAYGNRFGYPRPATVERYQTTGATLLDTAEEGAITFRLELGRALTVERTRRDRRHYWNAP